MKWVRVLPAFLLAVSLPAGAAQLPPCDGTFQAVGEFELRGIDRPVGIGATGDDAWVVASTLPGNGDYEILAWHHSNDAWEELPRPEAAEGEWYVAYGADVDATGTLWVAGERGTDEGERHLVLRWDGSAWEQMEVPDVGVEGYLTDIEAVSPTNVWAVGAYDTRRGLEQSLVMHFGGTEWTRYRAPSPGCCSSLADVSLSSDGEGWASGWAREGLLLRLEDETWERVPLDYLGRVRVGVVESAGAGRAWASGSIERGGGPPQGAILRWNGARWRRAEVPDPAGQEGYYAIDSNAAGVWAAGARWRRATGWASYAIARRDGSWSRVPIEPAGTGENHGIFAIDASTGQVWAAGEASDGQRHLLTVHRACSPPQ